MRANLIRRLLRALLSRDAENMCFREASALDASGRFLARGVAIDGTPFDKHAFAVTWFILPLYVPTDHLHYTYGARLGMLTSGGKQWWEYSDDGFDNLVASIAPQFEKEAMQSWKRFGNLQGFETLTYEDFVAADRLRVAEARLYTARLLQDERKFLRRVSDWNHVKCKVRDPLDWQCEVIERVELFLSVWKRDPEAADSLLHDWERGTREALRL